jgi:hypothetical protein
VFFLGNDVIGFGHEIFWNEIKLCSGSRPRLRNFAG